MATTGKKMAVWYVPECFRAAYTGTHRMLQCASSMGSDRTWKLVTDDAEFRDIEKWHAKHTKNNNFPDVVVCNTSRDLSDYVRKHCVMNHARSTHGKVAAR